MPGFNRSVVIAKPIDEVFSFATDLANASVFMPNIVKTELLTEGGMRVGAKFRETRSMNGKERSAVIEISEYERPTLYAAYAAMFGMRATYRFRFAPEGAGTRVDMEADVQGNIFWKLFLGMMSRMMEKEDGQYLTRMKEAMERATPA